MMPSLQRLREYVEAVKLARQRTQRTKIAGKANIAGNRTVLSSFDRDRKMGGGPATI
jgi:hypothetical protein